MVDARTPCDSGGALRRRRMDRHRASLGASLRRQLVNAMKSPAVRNLKLSLSVLAVAWPRSAGSLPIASIADSRRDLRNLRRRSLPATSFSRTSITLTKFTTLSFVKPLLAFSRFVLEWVVDVAILGGLAWLLGGLATLGGAILQRWQSGNLRSYAAWLAFGAAALLLFVLVPWTSVLAGFGIHVGMVGH